MDLLEVFLDRCIQPLQECDHPLWMYSGLEDTTRIHPEEVGEDTLESWLRGITDNKDNPQGIQEGDSIRQLASAGAGMFL